jgi:hypothetical protein
MRTALVTTVRREHDELVDQVGGLSLGSTVPDFHVVIALADRAVTQGRLPITSDRWETLVDGLPTVKQQLPTARALDLGATTAIHAGAELLIFLEAAAIPGPHLIERTIERVGQGGHRHPVLWYPEIARLHPPGPGGYELANLAARVRVRSQPLLPGVEEVFAQGSAFVSPCFAMTSTDYSVVGGLSTDYVSGKGHDTDLATAVLDAGGNVVRISGATAYVRHQPTAVPDKVQLASVATNANLYYQRWGRWPEVRWLAEMVDAGLVRLDEDGTCVVTGAPAEVMAAERP